MVDPKQLHRPHNAHLTNTCSRSSYFEVMSEMRAARCIEEFKSCFETDKLEGGWSIEKKRLSSCPRWCEYLPEPDFVPGPISRVTIVESPRPLPHGRKSRSIPQANPGCFLIYHLPANYYVVSITEYPSWGCGIASMTRIPWSPSTGNTANVLNSLIRFSLRHIGSRRFSRSRNPESI